MDPVLLKWSYSFWRAFNIRIACELPGIRAELYHRRSPVLAEIHKTRREARAVSRHVVRLETHDLHRKVKVNRTWTWVFYDLSYLLDEAGPRGSRFWVSLSPVHWVE